MKKVFFILIILISGFYTIAFSDVFYLKNKEKIKGRIIEEDKEKIKVKTSSSVIAIEKSHIDKIESERPENEIKPIDLEGGREAEESLEEELKTVRASIPEKINQAKALLEETLESLLEEREVLLTRQKKLEEELEITRTSTAEKIEQARAPLQKRIESLEDELTSVKRDFITSLKRNLPKVETYISTTEQEFEEKTPYLKEPQATYDDKDQDVQSISNYTKAIEINPKDDKSYNNRGIFYKKKGLYNQAIFDFAKAIEINPKYADAYYNRGNAYYCKGQYYQAIQDYNKAIEINPRDAEAYFNKAAAYEKVGRLKEAADAYKFFIQYAPPEHVSRIEYAKKTIKAFEE